MYLSSMRRRRHASKFIFPCLGVAALALAACTPPGGRLGPRGHPIPIDTLAIRAHTRFLASDLLRGRGTGTPEADIAALYIASACRELGLEPVGGSFRHAVPLEAAAVVRMATTLSVARGGANGGDSTLRFGSAFTLAGGTTATLHGFAGRAVWIPDAATALRAPDSLPDLRGRLAIVGTALRGAAADTMHARGAVGFVRLVDDSARFRLYRASRGTVLFTDADPAVRSSFFPAIPGVIAGPGAAEVLRAAAARGDSVTVTMAFVRRPVHAENVACLLPGRDSAKSDALIAFSAHYDHLGVGLPDATGDSIYNGFSDNAAGVGMLLAIARAFEPPARRLRHGLLFLFFTGEERGLLGSDHWVAHPPIPLSRLRAVINLDAGAPPGRVWNWRLAGGPGPLADAAIRVAQTHGWTAVTSPATPNSDYFPFAREGVPAIFPIPGSGPYEGLTSDSSDALRARWDHYHQPSDAWHADFPFGGLERYAEYAALIARAVDTER